MKRDRIKKLDKIVLNIDFYGKNLEKSTGVVRIDQNVLFSEQISFSK